MNEMDKKSENSYRIRLKKGNFEVEVQGDKEWVEQKFKELTSKEIKKGGDREEEHEETKGMPETLGEFLDVKGNPKKHTDATAVFAYWLLKVENVESFNVTDIENCYDQTRKTKPRSIHVAMITNVQRHVFAEAKEKKDGKKAWVITRKGEEIVEAMK